jgi:phage shock protein A
MGIFARISDIISANLNGLLDKAENPELMIAQVIREMEKGLANAKHYAAGAIAAERRIGRELDQNRTQAALWKTRACQALAAGREDMARRALLRKREHDHLVHCLEAQHAAALATSDKLRASLRALEARLAEARRKQRALLARHRAALARVQVNRVFGAGLPDIAGADAQFERLESRLADFEDEVGAQAELAQLQGDLDVDLADRDTERAIEAELEALKRQPEITQETMLE